MNITRLKHIMDNHFSIVCICGHAGKVPVQGIVDSGWSEDMTADEVELRYRCSRCRGKGNFKRFQIIYVGNSDIAMSSAYSLGEREDAI